MAKATRGLREKGPSRWQPAGINSARALEVSQTIAAAEKTGLISAAKDDRISARLSHELLAQAKARTGIAGTTELLEFALASIALEDRFLDTMERFDGAVADDIKLGF